LKNHVATVFLCSNVLTTVNLKASGVHHYSWKRLWMQQFWNM